MTEDAISFSNAKIKLKLNHHVIELNKMKRFIYLEDRYFLRGKGMLVGFGGEGACMHVFTASLTSRIFQQ